MSEELDPRRSLPRVDSLLAEPQVAALPRGLAREVARELLAAARRERSAPIDRDWAGEVAAEVRRRLQPHLRPVINATGVVVHTNLGRSPWSAEARQAALGAMGYCNAELDLPSGERGGRLDGVRRWLLPLIGAEEALVVNNCAAAVLLALTALAAGKEVLVSRGELVEIGGSFRVPEVITAGGARLVEVGTTNRTRAADYARAVGPETAALLRVHPSNFLQVGFVESPDPVALGALAKERQLWWLEDLGSGEVAEARATLARGADLVLFSGDKLLGGPQAGIVAGRAAAVGRLRSHPLYRALRVDKVTLAALEATLRGWATDRPPPVASLLSGEGVEGRTEALAAQLRADGWSVQVAPVDGRAGGGAWPERPLPGVALGLTVADPNAFARRLRLGEPPVVARVAEGRLWIDLRTVAADEMEALRAALARADGRGVNRAAPC